MIMRKRKAVPLPKCLKARHGFFQSPFHLIVGEIAHMQRACLARDVEAYIRHVCLFVNRHMDGNPAASTNKIRSTYKEPPG